MRRPTPLPLLVLVAVLALALGSVGTAVARPVLTPHVVKKLAAKVVKKKAKHLSVENAATLGGQPPAAYLSTAYTSDITNTANVTSFDKALPAVPAGTYQASVYVTAAMSSSNAELFCSLYQQDQTADLIDVYGSRYSSFRTVAATRTIAVTGTLHLYCRASSGTITAVPANPNYAAGQVSLQRVDVGTAIGPAAKVAEGSAKNGAPTR